MQQWERYRFFVRHRETSGSLARGWLEEVRAMERRLGNEGWALVSANALIDEDALVEILWFQRPISPGAPVPPPE